MRAMILAAGRGERMKELTHHTPKPLLRVAKHYLIEYSIFNLKRAGIEEIVINVSYHGEQIKRALKDGKQYGVTIAYSEEKDRLETGGGILQALPLLGEDPFVVTSSDIITDYPFAQLPIRPPGLAHLVMVDNPRYYAKGDFGIADGRLDKQATPTYTYGNICVLRKELFHHCQPGHFRLGQLFHAAIEKGQLTGEYYPGKWQNIGTAEDLQLANKHAS